MSTWEVGVDLSRWDGKVNWSVLLSRQPGFIIIRSSYAGRTLDDLFVTDRHIVEKSEAPYGIYHVPSADNDLRLETSLLNLVVQTEPTPQFVALDLEIYHRSLPKRALDLAYHITDNYNLPVFIYTNWDFRNKYTDQQFPKQLFGYPLWVAHWTTRNYPLIPRGWADYDLWQYSANGNKQGLAWGVSARDIDLNRTNPKHGKLSDYLEKAV